MSKSVSERVNGIKVELSALVQAHNDGTYTEGPEALFAEVEELLESAGLISVETCDVGSMGVFPGNREGSMLVPSDVHGLLAETFMVNGYNAKKWECEALSVPPSLKVQWLQANQELVARSDGLLPAIHDLDYATGIGSHGTAALRAMKFPCRAIHAETAGPDGMVSFGKITAKQPSLKKPVERGVTMRVIRGELEEAVPGTFQVLSRLGNVSNSHYRLQTTLQSCLRIHQVAVNMKKTIGDIDWNKVGVQASIGMTTAEARNVDKLCTFVQHWSGGDDCPILKQLESFEKTLHHKRFIRADDLATLGECDQQYPRIVQAFHKARMYGASSKCSPELLALDMTSCFIRLLWPCGLSGVRALGQTVRPQQLYVCRASSRLCFNRRRQTRAASATCSLWLTCIVSNLGRNT